MQGPYSNFRVDEPGYVTFMVKKYPNGKGSGKMHSMVPGESLSFRALAEFPYKANQFTHMSLIAGGSGITPIYQLIRTVLRNPADKTKLTLIYANNTEEDILLKSEFDDLEKKYPDRFTAVYAVSNPSGDGNFHKGYVNKQILERVMADAKGGDKIKVLVSGPPPMTNAIAGSKGGFGWTQGSVGGILKELGYSNSQVFKF
jgi:cytochrome-b5 reductase